jgi:hypothetical protein
VAPWLSYALRSSCGYSGNVKPYTYAAPSAGNAVFASWQSRQFPGVRVYNSLDLVPMAWAELLTIPTLFSPPGPECPSWFSDVVKSVHVLLTGLQYAQPTSGDRQLIGALETEVSFFDEAADQHGHNNYLNLLRAPTLPFRAETTPVVWSESCTEDHRDLIGIVRRRVRTPQLTP